MERNYLVCSSLRRRPDWAALPSALTSSRGSRWREKQLDTHDVALPFPLPPSASAPALASSTAATAIATTTATTTAPLPPPRALRVIFLAPEDVGSEATQTRLERLYHLDGGRDAAVVFLLKRGGDGGEDPMTAFARLQLSLVGSFEMPVIPVHEAAAAPRVLQVLHQRLSTSRAHRASRTPNPARILLPYCSDRPPLSEHTVNVLSDITTGFRGLLDGMSTGAGRATLEEYLDADADRAMAFWREEYLVD